jgi:hypothetical protein
MMCQRRVAPPELCSDRALSGRVLVQFRAHITTER